MVEFESTWTERVERLSIDVGHVSISRGPACDSVDVLVAVTSSRLGHDSALHRIACRFLCQSLLDSRHRGAALLVASGSAIEPWAVRAAELFAVPVILLSVDPDNRSADIFVRARDGRKLSRDAAAISIADRVDAVFVRRGGTVQACLQRRIVARGDASTRVAVSLAPKCAAKELIDAGAIGWFCGGAGPQNLAGVEATIPHSLRSADSIDDAWIRTEGQWLIHCTRAPAGAWPGETERQYRDSMLIGRDDLALRRPIDALMSIIRSGKIVAAATATTKKHPVVCFSSRSLHELLQRRCFRPQLNRWDYEPYGIAIRLTVARQLGIQPVVYGLPKDRSTLSPDQQFRFHPIGRTFDWREEREWRSKQSVDLTAIDFDDVRVFAEDKQESRKRLQRCPWSVTFVQAMCRTRQADSAGARKRV